MRSKMTPSPSVNAAGRVDVLAWLRANGCPWTAWTTKFAAMYGRYDAFRWAVDRGCPVDRDTMVSLASAGRLDELRRATFNRQQQANRVHGVLAHPLQLAIDPLDLSRQHNIDHRHKAVFLACGANRLKIIHAHFLRRLRRSIAINRQLGHFGLSEPDIQIGGASNALGQIAIEL